MSIRCLARELALVDHRERHDAAGQVAERDLFKSTFDRTVDAEHEAPRRTSAANRADGTAAIVGSLAFDEIPLSFENFDELAECDALRITFERVTAAGAAMRFDDAAGVQR